MKSIPISARNYIGDIDSLLLQAGYKRHKDNFIKQTKKGGRFHFIKDNNKYGRLHFDLYIDGKHSVFAVPETLQREKDRILKTNSMKKTIKLDKRQRKVWEDQLKTELKRYRKTGKISPTSPFKRYIENI